MKQFLIPGGMIAAIGIGWVAYAGFATKAYASERIVLVPITHSKYDPSKIERDIELHEGRVKRDPTGAIGWAMLSGAYLAKSREQDDDLSSWKSEEAARKSLAIRRRGNPQGAIRLAQALLEQHRFQDALIAADDAIRISPGEDQAKMLRADVLIELDRLAEAEKQLRAVELPKNDPSFLAIQARIESAYGKHDQAFATWNRAILELDQMGHIGEEFIAWYHAKAGSELLKLGKPGEAKSEFQTALTMSPKSYKAALGLAESALAAKDWKTAVAWADTTLDMVNSFRAMAVRGEALQQMGDEKGAQSQFAKMHEAFLDEDSRYAKLGKGGPLGVRHPDREFATFCATTGMFLKDGLRAAKRDFANRPDGLAKSNIAKLEQHLSS